MNLIAAYYGSVEIEFLDNYCCQTCNMLWQRDVLTVKITAQKATVYIYLTIHFHAWCWELQKHTGGPK